MNWPIDPRNGKPMILGPVELEMLEATKGKKLAVREVRNGKAYTTNMTTLDRLFKKGLLWRKRVGRAFVYSALLFLFLAQSVVAGPLKKIVHVVTNHVTLGIVAGASSGYQAGGTQWCRSHNPDVEGCTAHYGSGTGVSIANGVLTGGMIALSEYGRKHKFKEWALPEVAVTGFNIFWGTRQFTTHEKTDITHTALRFKP